jgi:glycosyltransferase involved in cell wall biosynthesis
MAESGMMSFKQRVLILTPVKNAEPFLESYFQALDQLTYPHELISLGFLERDSTDGTYSELERRLSQLKNGFRAALLWKKDFGFHLAEGTTRWDDRIQIERRAVLAKSRNHLLFRALDDEDWVLWLDVDIIEYPSDIIQQLLAAGKEIVQPHCVKEYGGMTYDLNAWRDRGKYHLQDLREEGDLVKLHAVGGTMVLIKADVHRQGLVFPPFLYGRRNALMRKDNQFVSETGIRSLFKRKPVGEIETEGLGLMAYDMGYECWGMPHLEIRHHSS